MSRSVKHAPFSQDIPFIENQINANTWGMEKVLRQPFLFVDPINNTRWKHANPASFKIRYICPVSC
jgi:hypothetical protein